MILKVGWPVKIYKKTIVRLFFLIEVIIFVGVYLFGANGLQYLIRLQNENNQLKNEIVDLQKEVKIVEQEIVSWQSDDFFKEKIAREQLQMARKGDEIYLVDDQAR